MEKRMITGLDLFVKGIRRERNEAQVNGNLRPFIEFIIELLKESRILF
jgi:hypothetical protein